MRIEKSLGQFLAKIHLTSWFLATELCHSQLDIHFGDAQEEAEDLVWPILCCPNNLQTNS